MTPIQSASELVSATKTVPSYWPNRSTRRAIKQNREHRLSSVWRMFLAVNPTLRQAIKGLA